MTGEKNRFTSDGVFHALPALPPAPPQALTQALAHGRMTNPKALGLATTRLVASIDMAIQEALDETPRVLWDKEEIIRFELPEARVILTLAEADQPGAAGLTIAVIFEGENAPEIAQALCRLILRQIESRYPALVLEERDQPLDEEARALALAPLSGSQPILAPVETLEDAMWRRAISCQPRRPPAAPPPETRWWQFLRLPRLTPLRPAVRGLGLVLFAIGLLQGPLGQSAEAESMVKATGHLP